MQGRSLLVPSNEDHRSAAQVSLLIYNSLWSLYRHKSIPKQLLNYNYVVIIFLSQITDGNTSNVDITAPGAIIALALMYLKVGLEDVFDLAR